MLADTAVKIVVVPGGGPFADQVRDLQRRWRFDDGTAHRLALLAMEQYGGMLAGLHRGFVPAASRAEIAQAHRGARVPVWMPTRMALSDSAIAESWDVTSDSLAAWLSGKMELSTLLLVKAAALAGARVSAATLARRGIVDAAFPAMLARAGRPCWSVNARRHAAVAQAWRAGTMAGTEVTAESLGATDGALRRPARLA